VPSAAAVPQLWGDNYARHLGTGAEAGRDGTQQLALSLTNYEWTVDGMAELLRHSTDFFRGTAALIECRFLSGRQVNQRRALNYPRKSDFGVACKKIVSLIMYMNIVTNI